MCVLLVAGDDDPDLGPRRPRDARRAIKLNVLSEVQDENLCSFHLRAMQD